MVGKNARSNFSRNTRIVRVKNVGKKSSEKSANKPFLFSHEYRDQKMGGKKARNNFSGNTRIVRAINVGKKIVRKKGEKTFFIFRISWPRKGGKNARNNFSRNTSIVRAKNVGKNRRKNGQKRFLYSHEYRDQNIVGKTRETIFPEIHE